LLRYSSDTWYLPKAGLSSPQASLGTKRAREVFPQLKRKSVLCPIRTEKKKKKEKKKMEMVE